MKKVKTLIALMAIATMMGLTVSCGNDDDNDNNGGASTGNSFISADGTTSGKLKIVEAKYNEESGEYELSLKGDVTNEIDEIRLFTEIFDGNSYKDILLEKNAVSNGEFSFKFPTPSDEYLDTFDDLISNGITISDKTAKTATWINLNGFKNDEKAGYILLTPSNLTFDIEVGFIYVDKDVKLIGTYERDYEQYDETSIRIYDMDLKKGWNTLICRSTIDGNKYTSKYTANEKLSNMIWAVEIFNNDDTKHTKGFRGAFSFGK